MNYTMQVLLKVISNFLEKYTIICGKCYCEKFVTCLKLLENNKDVNNVLIFFTKLCGKLNLLEPYNNAWKRGAKM